MLWQKKNLREIDKQILQHETEIKWNLMKLILGEIQHKYYFLIVGYSKGNSIYSIFFYSFMLINNNKNKNWESIHRNYRR